MQDMAQQAQVLGSSKPAETPGAVTRTIGGWLVILLGVSGALSALIAGAWAAVIPTALIAPLGWLLTPAGKRWRAAQKLKVPGWGIAIGVFALILVGQPAVERAESQKIAADFAHSGESRISQARAALQRGEAETAEAVLAPIKSAKDPRLEPLAAAIEVLKEAGGDKEKATSLLKGRVRNNPNDQARYLAAMSDIVPQEGEAFEGLLRQEAETKALEERKAAEEKAENDLLAAHFSKWDGSHPAVVEAVKAQMNDPSSFKHVETTAQGKGDTIIVYMTYRGTNAFGGVVTNHATAVVDTDGRLRSIAIGR